MVNGNSAQTSWIPEKYAHNGRILRLKANHVWSDGWVVVRVGIRLPEEYVREYSSDYRHQREASDI